MKKNWFSISILLVFLWSCGEEQEEFDAFEATNREETFAPLDDESKILGAYHFGDSEMESTLIINKSKDGYYAQLRSGSFNDDGTAWIWDYENFKNVKIEGSKFYSDKTNGEFLISEDAGTIDLKVEKSWSYDGESEMGYQTLNELKSFYSGDYSEASYKTLKEKDIAHLPKRELQIMRNEVFARYGLKFKKGGKMDAYFNVLDWYSDQHKSVDAFLTSLEKENIALIKKLESKLPDDEAQLTSEEMEEGLIGNWSCNSGKLFTLSADGSFHAEDYNYKENGTWLVKDNRLLILLEKDTIKFTLSSASRTKLVIESVDFNDWHEFLCSSGGYRIYTHLYKELPIGRSVKNALVGYWYSSEGFELKANGTYIHHGPDCEDGTWDYKKDEGIVIEEQGCGGMSHTFENLTTERLVIGEHWTLFRVHEEESVINTPKTE